MSGKIQNLLEQANYSAAEDSSVNQAKRNLRSEAEAKDFFVRKRGELLNIDKWNAHSTPSDYELFVESGAAAGARTIEVGKFIRIKVAASGKPDWVKAVDIYDAPDEFVLTVQPSYDPTADSPDRTETSHFFKSEATNNFCLLRDDESVSLYVVGLNEKANVKEAGGPIEALRNVATANFGYYLGLQKAMWTEFCARFMEIGEE